MTDQIKLAVESRTLFGKKVGRLRRAGILPATVYGKGVGPFAIQINTREFEQTYRQAGRTSLIQVQVPGQPVQSVFVHAVQRHPVRREPIHVDFLVVDLRADITVAVPVHYVGESELVKRNEGVVNHLLTTIDVRTLPANVPSSVEVDTSVLQGFDQNVLAGDIVLPDNVELITPADTIVASITQSSTQAEAEEAAAELQEALAEAEPEVTEEATDEAADDETTSDDEKE